LHSHLDLEKYVSDSFILFKPKDIVSGDFYWINKVNDWLIVAVVDCTGHGVPGAFMSMLGISFLNEIVRKNEIMQTNQILNHLRVSIIDALNQTGNSDEQKDGMDISLLAIKYDENSDIFDAQWSGANNPLWIVKSEKLKVKSDISTSSMTELSVVERSRDTNLTILQSSNLTEVKGDTMPISIHNRMDDFTMHEFKLQKGDLVYLKTDGFEDAMGGAIGKKILSKNLKQILLDNCNLPMLEQKIFLENYLTNWIGLGEQIDDVTILGIKI